MGKNSERPLKPNKEPNFATLSGYASGPIIGFDTKVEPTDAEKAQGNYPSEEPPPQKSNWLRNLYYRWTQYFNAFPVGIIKPGPYRGFRVEEGSGTGLFSVVRHAPLVDVTGSITAFALAASGTDVTAPGHGLSDNDKITITGTANYNGSYTITYIDEDSFNITAAYVATETGTWTLDTEGHGFFMMDDGTKVTMDQDYADFNAGSPASAYNPGTGAYRKDAVYLDYDPAATTPTIAFAYQEDIVANPIDLSMVLAVIFVQDNATYTIDQIIQSPKLDLPRASMVIGDGEISDNVDVTSISDLQDYIDILNLKGGGVINVVGKHFGHHTATDIKMKSGVTLRGIGMPFLSPISGDTNLAAWDGDSSTGATAADGTLTDGAVDFYDYGIGSRVEFTSGANNGVIAWVRQIIDSNNVLLVDEYMNELTLAVDAAAAYEIYISNSYFEDMGLDCNDHTVSQMIHAQYTYRCGIRRCHLTNKTKPIVPPTHIYAVYWEQKNKKFELVDNFITGIWGQFGFANIGLTISGGSVANNPDWIVRDNNSSAIMTGIFAGLYDNNKGFALNATDDAGWFGGPATTEHDTDGTHIGDVARFFAGFTVKVDATALSTYTAPHRVGGPSISYLGDAAFVVVDGSYGWQVRRNGPASAVYHVRPACTIAGGVVTPDYDPDDVFLQIFDLDITPPDTIACDWNSAAGNKWWVVAFSADTDWSFSALRIS